MSNDTRAGPEDDTASQKKAPDSRPTLKKEWLGFLIKAAVFIAVIAVIFTQLLMLKRVTGNNMFPFLKDGDLALVVRHPGTLESGDVVVYEADGELHFGRILTVGAAEVNIDGSGAAYVNGIQESGENVLFPTNDPGTITYPCEVPEGSYFLLNDMREEVTDSRTYGVIAGSAIRGRVASFLRRRGV